MVARTVSHEEVKANLLKDPEFKRYYDELELPYQIIRLRLRRGLTQRELAEKVGTTQSVIARLESGKQKPSLSFLERVVAALDAHLDVRIESMGIDELN